MQVFWNFISPTTQELLSNAPASYRVAYYWQSAKNLLLYYTIDFGLVGLLFLITYGVLALVRAKKNETKPLQA